MMDERNGRGAVDCYLESLSVSPMKNDEDYTSLYVNGATAKTDGYIETIKKTNENIIMAEYESTKIIKCRRYKLYKAGKQ